MDRELKKIASELNLELGSINSTVSSQSPASLFGIAQDKQKEDGQVGIVSYVTPITALWTWKLTHILNIYNFFAAKQQQTKNIIAWFTRGKTTSWAFVAQEKQPSIS